jgi:hypothetical protein
MTIAVVQVAELFGAFSGNFSSPVTAGNTIFLLASAYNASGATISSSDPEYDGSIPAGSVKLKDEQSPISGGDSVYGTIWMLPDVAGGATSVILTVTNGENVSSTGLVAIEVSGLGASPSLDQSASDQGNSTGPTSGPTGDITAAPEIILGAGVEFAQAVTPPGSPWTSYRAGADYTAFGYQIVTSDGNPYTYACTSSSAAPWCGMIATVQGTGGGTPHTATAALTVTPSFAAAATKARVAAAALTVHPAFAVARAVAHVRSAALTVRPSFAAAASGGAITAGSGPVLPLLAAMGVC